MRDITIISRALFDKIRSRFEGIALGDEEAKSTVDPEEARFFNFKFTTKSGNALTFVTMSLIDEGSLRVYFSKTFPEKMTEEEKKEWYEFLRSLRKFAKNNLLTFDPKDIAKSNLDLRDIKQQAKSDSVYKSDEFTVNESTMYGTNKKSYQDHGSCRICVDHRESINLETRGARARKISKVFLENSEGERFKLRYPNLHYARALAEHITNGGTIYDQIAENITSLVAEMTAMGTFVRGAKRQEYQDIDTQAMVESAAKRYHEIKETICKLSKKKHYDDFVENYVPETLDEDINVSELRDKFTKRVYNTRFDEALPYVYWAHRRIQEQKISEEIKEFDEWTRKIVEGTWALPDSESQIRELDDIMQAPVMAGLDGINAHGIFRDIIGDDDLFDLFTQAGHSDEDTDVRSIVIKWLDENEYKKLARRYKKIMLSQNDDNNNQQNDNVGDSSTDSEIGDDKSRGVISKVDKGDPTLRESVNDLVKLAGLKKI